MSSEISLIDFDECDGYSRSPYSASTSNDSSFQERIFVHGSNFQGLARGVTLHIIRSNAEQRVQAAANNRGIAPMGASVSGEVGVTVEWGGSKGTEVSGHASGSVSDDKGNAVDATVEVASDGSGSATVSASHEEKSGS